ncbi:MAG: LPXTG cell wall anchor domain-containing protein [Clostridium sp.]
MRLYIRLECSKCTAVAALPKTGQSGASGLVLFLSSMMLAAFVAVSKKREDDK